MEVSLDELNETEAELLEQVEAQTEYAEKIRNRVCNLIRQKFRLHRALMFVEQEVERRKKHGKR